MGAILMSMLSRSHDEAADLHFGHAFRRDFQRRPLRDLSNVGGHSVTDFHATRTACACRRVVESSHVLT